MATTKPSTKKKPSAKPASTKTTVTKKTAAPTKKPVAKKASAKKGKPEAVRSFQLSRESENFISSRITRQTVYWAILAVFILVVGVYVINIQLEILETLDQLSRNA